MVSHSLTNQTAHTHTQVFCDLVVLRELAHMLYREQIVPVRAVGRREATKKEIHQ